MGQLCCFPFSQTEEKISGNSEPEEAELLKVSKRLVEDAVNRALHQYKQESLQNGGGPSATTKLSVENMGEIGRNTFVRTTGSTVNIEAKYNSSTDTMK